MNRILRIFIVGRRGNKEAFAFDLDKFVSYNVDTRLLLLESGSVYVHKDSEEALIKTYRGLDGLLTIRMRKLVPEAVVPCKAHEGDAGWDLTATSKSFDDNGNVVYGTGWAFEIPRGYVGLLFPRSSNAKKDLLLSNSVGVLDSGYRGEVMFKFKLTKLLPEGFPQTYEIGDKIGQLVVIPYPSVAFVESEELSNTDRGKGGFGSTGA